MARALLLESRGDTKSAAYDACLDDAIACYERAIARGQLMSAAACHSNLGVCQLKKQRHESALKSFQSGVDAASASVLQSEAGAKKDASSPASSLSLPRLNLALALMAQGPFEKGLILRFMASSC